MTKNNFKINMKSLIVFSIIILFVVILFLSLKESSNDEIIEEINTEEPEVEEPAGLSQLVEVGDLSFLLSEVEYNGRNMAWRFIVSNNGQRMERVSNCGILLFEDGYQYSIRGVECEDYELVPGARVMLQTNFHFPSPKIWDEDQGSKLSHFLEQNNELIKYTIDKNEIMYT